MVDRISQAHRSWNMSRIRGKDTIPEIKVRSLLHRMGYRFRLHRKDLPGRPDIVLPGRHTVVLVHGCFWHRHPSCPFSYNPKSRVKFWEKKFAETVKRDLRQKVELGQLGWEVIIVWECELKELAVLRERLESELNNNTKNRNYA